MTLRSLKRYGLSVRIFDSFFYTNVLKREGHVYSVLSHISRKLCPSTWNTMQFTGHKARVVRNRKMTLSEISVLLTSVTT